jgi:hypothetical protein
MGHHGLHFYPILLVWSRQRFIEAGHGDMRSVQRDLIGEPEGKRFLGRPRTKCDDNKMDAKT